MDTNEPYFQKFSEIPAAHEVQLEALAPEYEAIRRKQAIVEDPRFHEIVKNDPYEIYEADVKVFWVITDTYSFRVEIDTVPLDAGHLGPKTLVLHFGPVIFKDALL